MTTTRQEEALANPLLGREGDSPLFWEESAWKYALSFNR